MNSPLQMSLLNYQHLLQQIRDKLFEIAFKVKCFNKSGDLDINRYAESYFRLLFNIIYKKDGWYFEKAIKINQDTYDLYDKQNKVCIQITSNNRSDKKNSTANSFEKNGHGDTFSTLIILFITETKPKPKKEKGDYTYLDYNIIEFGNLIETTCEQKGLLEIRDVLYESFNAPLLGPTKKTKGKNSKVSQREFLRRKKIETDLKKELVIPEYWKKFDHEKLAKEPFRKFKDDRFILRSIDDDAYPNGGENAKWSRTFMYDFYEKGILIDLGACIHYFAAINEQTDDWYILEYEEREQELPKGYIKKQILVLGKLPYKNIIYFQDGDEYYNDYHLFCKYEGVRNSPFDEIVYKYENGLGYYWDDLDVTKKIER